MEIARKLFETLGDISGDDALLLDILRTPAQGFSLATELVALQFHRSCQRDGTPSIGCAFKENLGCSRQPAATLRSINQRDEHTGIEHTSPMEELHRRNRFRRLFISTTRQYDLAESAGD